ncbi:hypothetical protein NQ117_18140 [Paenibacillus sp. SC116]|nr:hypothetical protein [Paenibacillus sp. SC116]
MNGNSVAQTTVPASTTNYTVQLTENHNHLIILHALKQEGVVVAAGGYQALPVTPSHSTITIHLQ